jgi:signal transduction histidine kinase
MAERARLAGGECRVVSTRGSGTKVVCRLPIDAVRDATTDSTVD